MIRTLEEEAGECFSANDQVKEEGFRLCGFEVEGAPCVILSGHDRVGTLYAAYGFLERLGLRFISPGEAGTCYHQAYDLSGETEFDSIENPDFTSRAVVSAYVLDTSVELVEWMSHARVNLGHIMITDKHHWIKKLGIRLAGGGHSIYYRFMETTHEYPYRHAIFGGEGKPEDPYPVSPLYLGDRDGDGILTYGDAHPEWYAEVDGERRMKRDLKAFVENSNGAGDNICTSNPYAREELCKLLIQDLIDGEWRHLDYLDVWALDNGVWCGCEECRKSGNLSYRLLMLTYQIDQEIKKATLEGRIKRKIRLGTLAYHETLPAPDRPLPDDFDYSNIFVTFFTIERCYLHHIDDPTCTECNRPLYDLYLPWTGGGHYKGQMFIGEYFNVSSFAAMPFVLSDKILHDMPFYYNTGTRHFHYMHITARDWGMIGINNYLYTRLMWNIRRDGEELMKEYFDLRYGELAEKMRDLYAHMETAGANCKIMKHYQFFDGKVTRTSGLFSKEGIEMFPTTHMKFDYRANSPMAGPSLVESVKLYKQCKEEFDAICREANAQGDLAYRLNEDKIRLYYGVEMLDFIEALVRFRFAQRYNPDLAPLAFEKVMAFGEVMQKENWGLTGYETNRTNLLTHLEATWLQNCYIRLLKTYHPENMDKNIRQAADLIL